MKHRPITRRPSVVALCASTALAATVLTASASMAGPAAAEAAPDGLTQMRALCLAGGGTFHPARFGVWRCQDAALDGMGTFWAERAVCEHVAHRSFAESPDPASGRGTWLCLPAGD